jgi:leader peptidase (prepilin peptidase) / N-methyltransferase
MMNLEHLALVVMALIFGACIGSFLNVVVYRLPAGLSLVHPPSRCPHCHHRLQPRDNIPVLGWILIGGKCRYCRSPVSWRYPAVEALTGLLFAGLASVLIAKVSLITLVFYGGFAAWLLALALIDLDTMTLPDQLTKSGLVLGLVFQLHQGIWQAQGTTNWAGALLFGIAGMVTGLWLLDSIRIGARYFLGKEAMGGGDPKLAAMIGMWLGWQQVLLVVMVAAFLGMIGGLIQVISQRKSLPFPFGPWLSLAALIVLVFGEGWIYQYLQWWGLTN